MRKFLVEPGRVPVGQITAKDAAEEAAELRDSIRYHDERYYAEAAPEISDRAYDRLLGRLRAIEERFPSLRTPGSPTEHVAGAPTPGAARITHAAPMLSLDTLLRRDEVEAFDRIVRKAVKGPRYVVEPKFDGVSVELVYEGGRFARASTRGDGMVGDDVTENLRTVKGLPARLRGEPPRRLAVRGELLLPKTAFQRLNKARLARGEEPFANPRNAAAGTVRRLEPAIVAKMPLQVFVYEILGASGRTPDTHVETLRLLRALGFPTDPHDRTVETVDEIARFHASLAKEREDLPYEIDGVVVKLDDVRARERLGMRARSPRWAVAWKFPPKQEVTRLVDIVVQTGRTGRLTPVALLDPVDVGGVTVARATLHNPDEVARLDVRPGDMVRIERAGDVIPHVAGRVRRTAASRRTPWRMPATCPSCGAKAVREGVAHLCPAGLACHAQLTGHLLHFASRDAMDIEGLGPHAAAQLIAADAVKDIADLYAVTEEDVGVLTRFGAKSAANLHRAIQGSKRPPLARFVQALGIPHVGRRTAQILAAALRDLDALAAADEDALLTVPGVGPETATAVHRFFANQENRDVLRRLDQAGVRPRAEKALAGQLAGKTFVFTGTLEGLTRSEASERVEARGGQVGSRVSAATDYVVAGQKPGQKIAEARRLGVEVLDKKAFLGLLEK